ncbi:MAG: hypothetical protein A4E27_00169 [Methanobacterium sp. PtaU1.Bin242]|nr:MAG: hypothetical protein A4E27_00169 [Methanobacterium sp. PtaU1.Bin242]
MDKYKVDMKRHCYFEDERYPISICDDYIFDPELPRNSWCKRYNKEIKTEFVVDERHDGVGHFYGQVHKFPLKLDCCEYKEND